MSRELNTLYNSTAGTTLSSRLSIARTLWQRLVGFLPRKRIQEDEAMWFDGCASVHTLGMRASIDIVFLDNSFCVLAVERNVGPNRLSVSHAGAASILELGVSQTRRIAAGDVLAFVQR